MRTGLFAAMLWTAAALPPTPVQAAISLSQDAQINRGEIVVTLKQAHPIYYLDVYGVVDATPDAVWHAITTYDRYQDFLPMVVESGIRKREPGKIWQYVRMQPPWPLHDHWMVNANVENKRTWNISWTMADGNLRMEHGFWQITPLPSGKTRLQYHLTVDPWLDKVPGWLIELATKTVLPDVIKGVRKRVRTHPHAG